MPILGCDAREVKQGLQLTIAISTRASGMTHGYLCQGCVAERVLHTRARGVKGGFAAPHAPRPGGVRGSFGRGPVERSRAPPRGAPPASGLITGMPLTTLRSTTKVRSMSYRGFLSLLFLGLFGFGLGSLALPEEIAPAHHLYDGDEDDAAMSVPGRTNVHTQPDDFLLGGLPNVPTYEARWFSLVPHQIRITHPPPLRTRLTRAPPAR